MSTRRQSKRKLKQLDSLLTKIIKETAIELSTDGLSRDELKRIIQKYNNIWVRECSIKKIPQYFNLYVSAIQMLSSEDDSVHDDGNTK